MKQCIYYLKPSKVNDQGLCPECVRAEIEKAMQEEQEYYYFIHNKN